MGDRDTVELVKRLVSALQGAPYPTDVPGELYSIWYDHAQTVAQDALEYLATKKPSILEEELPTF